MNRHLIAILAGLGALLAAATAAAQPVVWNGVRATFVVEDPDEAYRVVVHQGNRSQACPEIVEVGRPCTLVVQRGDAEIELIGERGRTITHRYEGDTRHLIEYRSSWPKWLGAMATCVGVVSVLIGTTMECDPHNPYDTSCGAGPGLVVVGATLVAVGAPFWIYGAVATGDRTEHQAEGASPVRVGVAPTRDGVRAAVTIEF